MKKILKYALIAAISISLSNCANGDDYGTPNLDADFDAPLFKEVENIKTSESSSIKKNEEFDIFNSPTRGGKTPQRVIVLYADGSFESYEHK
mgnify:CR=1 FL=1